jgi:4-hydroxymandelate oxidase
MNGQNLRSLEHEARARLEPAVYDFFAGGADDEVTLGANESAIAALRLLPRVLRGIGEPRLGLDLFGTKLASPVFASPTAFHKLAHPDGETATARACAAAHALYVVSMAATTSLEDVRKVAPEAALAFQIYLQPDRGFTEALVRRAERAGVAALFVSVDSPVFGRRERDLRNGFTDLPPHLACENMRGNDGVVRSITFSSSASWDDIDWLRAKTDLPIVVKGIAHRDDAAIAVRLGVAAVMVSNHGGRQLDVMPAAIDLLPPIADEVAGRVPVLFDGGVRRGTDVLKALALGATAVGVGRPILWGLAAGGGEGVARVFASLDDELRRALTLCGLGSIGEASRAIVMAGAAR